MGLFSTSQCPRVPPYPASHLKYGHATLHGIWLHYERVAEADVGPELDLRLP